MILNQGQRAALDKLSEFVLSDDKYFVLDAPGGFGKTTVISQLEDSLESINQTLSLFGLPHKGELHFCASTNKAASLFGRATTIHKLLKLKVVNNFHTGKSFLEQYENVFIRNAIVIIDEASMLGPDILNYLETSTAGDCKIIFLLDHCQLAPVGSVEPLVHGRGFPFAELTEPMRQKATSHLYQQCLRFRNGVLKQERYAPVAGEGVSIVDGSSFTNQIIDAFRNGEDVRVLAYSNENVENLNRFIRNKLNGDTLIRVGDTLTMATAKEGSKFVVEAMYTVQQVGPGQSWGTMKTQRLWLVDKHGLGELHTVPVDKQEYFKVLKELQYQGRKEGNWKPYYTFLATISDFRDVYACTVHKSQGSTYDKVFIDLQNIRKCHDLNTLVRLCYVAITRARHEAIYYTGE